MKHKSPQKHTVNEYVQSSGSKLNEYKGIGGEQTKITIENIENPQRFLAGVPETHANKSHDAGGMDLGHDINYTIPRQPAIDVDHTSTEQQAASQIFGISPKPQKDNLNARRAHTLDANVEYQTHNEAEQHHKSMEPFYAANVRIDKKEKIEENDYRLLVSPPEINATMELKVDRIPTNGFGECDYTVKGDKININIVINSEAIACDNSAPFDHPNVDSKPRVIIPDEGISSPEKTKSCDALLFRENKLSEAARSSYQDCVLKGNVIENELTNSKTEATILIAVLKETLAMIKYLKVNSTNKLVLKSSIQLTDYKQVLREVISTLLNVQPSQYNIVQSELESDNIVKFELGSYSEKLLLFLNGRIQLQGSNFQFIDCDAY